VPPLVRPWVCAPAGVESRSFFLPWSLGLALPSVLPLFWAVWGFAVSSFVVRLLCVDRSPNGESWSCDSPVLPCRVAAEVWADEPSLWPAGAREDCVVAVLLVDGVEVDQL